MSAVIDTKNQLLYLPGPGGLEVKCSPGSRVFSLEMSPSGHLILPIDHARDASELNTQSGGKGLDFNMTVREQATSPVRARVEPAIKEADVQRS